jgi:mannose-6-phosphate isomerase-like protein (cupin superfamily)
MKIIATIATLLTAAFLLIGAEGSKSGVQYFGHDEIAAKLAKGGPIASDPAFTVSASHRDKAGNVEVHDKETDIFYVTDGSATFVTGGKMIGGKQSKANQWLGTSIEGGETHNLSKGDVMIVPAGTPHWFQKVPSSISYYVVKSLKQ